MPGDIKKIIQNAINVNGEDYLINAYTADHTLQALEITKHNGENSEETIRFNGSTEYKLAIVPSTGGNFSGPISVPTQDKALDKIADTTVINKGEIEKIIDQLTGIPYYTWDGINVEEVTTEEGKVLQNINIIVGSLKNFKTFNSLSTDIKPCLYLAVTSGISSGNNYNEIYYCTKKSEYFTLATTASYGIIKGNRTSLEQLFTQNTAEHTELLENINRALLEINNIIDGNTSVSKALIANLALDSEHADYADRAKLADKATKADYAEKAGVATKAINDENGDNIADTYYRSGIGGTLNTNGIANSIFISTSNPTNEGTLGDIWIKYSIPTAKNN